MARLPPPRSMLLLQDGSLDVTEYETTEEMVRAVIVGTDAGAIIVGSAVHCADPRRGEVMITTISASAEPDRR